MIRLLETPSSSSSSRLGHERAFASSEIRWAPSPVEGTGGRVISVGFSTVVRLLVPEDLMAQLQGDLRDDHDDPYDLLGGELVREILDRRHSNSRLLSEEEVLGPLEPDEE